MPHRPRSSARPIPSRRGGRVRSRQEHQAPLDLEPIVVVLDVAAFIADKPSLDSFASGYDDLKQLGLLFCEHAARWRRETRHWSSLTKMVMHPSYRRIMGMGPDALPFILRELREHPDHWFVALNAITGEDPVPPDSTFDQAVSAWIVWGMKNGYLH